MFRTKTLNTLLFSPQNSFLANYQSPGVNEIPIQDNASETCFKMHSISKSSLTRGLKFDIPEFISIKYQVKHAQKQWLHNPNVSLDRPSYPFFILKYC